MCSTGASLFRISPGRPGFSCLVRNLRVCSTGVSWFRIPLGGPVFLMPRRHARIIISPIVFRSLPNFAGAFDDPNGSHISIEVVSDAFEGKRPVQRQQLVYKAIWEELQGPVHAVDMMLCQTPDERTKGR